MNSLQFNTNITAVKSLINGTFNRKIASLSKTTGFTKRNDAKLLPETLVKALTIGLVNVSSPTLQNIAYVCESMQDGLYISKEAVYQKMKAGSVLLKEVFKETLKCAVDFSAKACPTNQFKQFNNVYICDSTGIAVPGKLSNQYYGSGGTSKKGELNIQTIFSLVNRSVKNAEIVPGHVNDSLYTKELAVQLSENDLIMFDMGYRDKLGYKEIMDRKAFYLTRVMFNTTYFPPGTNMRYPNKSINIVDMLKKSNTNIVDIELLMGSHPDKRIKCRFVAIRLPEKIANDRIQRTLKKQRKAVLSNKEIEFLRWNTFITNAPVEKLPAESICNMYTMRWQIELLFKAFKSHLKLANLSNVGNHQLECILYGRLITATFMSVLYSRSYAVMFAKLQREISVLKYFSYLRNRSNEFIANVLGCPFSMSSLMKFLDRAAEESLYERRKRQSSLDKLIASNYFDLPNTG